MGGRLRTGHVTLNVQHVTSSVTCPALLCIYLQSQSPVDSTLLPILQGTTS